MVADLVNQYMGDNRAQRLAVLRPIVEDGPAIEENHVGQLPRLLDGGILDEPDALEKAKQIEFASGLHLIENLGRREILDTDEKIAAEVAEMGRQQGVGLGGQPIQVSERGSFQLG